MAKPTTERTSHHAHRLCRLLTKAAIAIELGPDACWMLTVIAHTEDARHYAGPVSFWRDQFVGICGCRSVNRMMRIRQRLIDAGWLIYRKGGNHTPSRYQTTIPPAYQNLPDTATDEYPEDTDSGSSTTERETELTRNLKRHPNGTDMELETTSKRNTFNPTPTPTPTPKKKAACAAVDLVALIGEVEESKVALDTPFFRGAWALWIQHRKEIGPKHALKPTQARSQLKMLGKLGAAAAIAMIEHTIEKGWIGLQAPDNQKGKTDGRSQTNRGTSGGRRDCRV